MATLTDDIIEALKKEADSIAYGEITLKFHADASHIDIITQKRERWTCKKKEKKT